MGAALLLRGGHPEAAARVLGGGAAIECDSERYPRADSRDPVDAELREALGPDRSARLVETGRDEGAAAALRVMAEEFART